MFPVTLQSCYEVISNHFLNIPFLSLLYDTSSGNSKVGSFPLFPPTIPPLLLTSSKTSFIKYIQRIILGLFRIPSFSKDTLFTGLCPSAMRSTYFVAIFILFCSSCLSYTSFVTSCAIISNSAAILLSFTRIRLSHASSFPKRFIPPCQTSNPSITA